MTMSRDAVLSPDGRYRYELRRTWNPVLPVLTWVMLNPSTADAEVDDPTIRRCVGFGQRWGYGGIVVRNLCAFRVTDPRFLYAALARGLDVVGPENWHQLAFCRPPVVCAWGALRRPLVGVAAQFHGLMRAEGVPLECLGMTSGGWPRHPLYVRGDAPLVPWTLPEVSGSTGRNDRG